MDKIKFEKSLDWMSHKGEWLGSSLNKIIKLVFKSGLFIFSVLFFSIPVFFGSFGKNLFKIK